MPSVYISIIVVLIAVIAYLLVRQRITAINKQSLENEEELKKSAQILEAEQRERDAIYFQQIMYESIPIPASLWNADFEIIDCNYAMLEFLQTPNKKDVINRFFEFSPKYQADGIPSKNKAKEIIASILMSDTIGRAPWIHEIDGKIIPIEIVGIRIKRNDEYLCAAYSVDMRLLESNLKLERELGREQERKRNDRQVNERIRAMLDATPLAIEIWDTDLNIVDCNKTTAELYGYPSKVEFMDNFKHHKMRYGEDVEGFFENIKKAFDKGEYHFEWDDLDQHGNAMQIETDAVCMILNDEPVVISYTKNVTQLKKAMAEMHRIEVAEASNYEKSRFLARMSHEIRTPISAVMGISEIELQNSELQTRMREPLTKIHTAAERLLEIVNDILDLSKLEVGKMKVIDDTYDVAFLLVEVSQMHPEYFARDDVKFILKIDDNTPAFLIGDMLRLKQILTNLLSNAFKYTATGSIEFQVHCVEHETDIDKVTLVAKISDTGHGMTKEQVEKLYVSEYVRFHESESREIGGTGLGLPIVFSLLKLMDADMEINSAVGVGTTIELSIPQRLSENTETIPKDTIKRIENFEQGLIAEGKTFTFKPEPMPYGSVLVVDDVEANLYVARGLLSFYQLKIDTCTSGYEAIDLIKSGNEYDIIFMDHMMKDLDGIETMQILRSMNYVNPIIALTANAMLGQEQEFMRYGFDGFISKPINSKILNSILLKFIRDRKDPEIVSKARKDSNWTDAKEVSDFLDGDELLGQLRHDFALRHKNTYNKLNELINGGNYKDAHILVHSLKSFAAMIKLPALSDAAFSAEKVFDKGEVPNNTLLFRIGNELNNAIESISEAQAIILKRKTATLDLKESIVLLDKLKPLLESQNMDCLDLLDEIEGIAGSEQLYESVSSLHFEAAILAIEKLRDTLKNK